MTSSLNLPNESFKSFQTNSSCCLIMTTIALTKRVIEFNQSQVTFRWFQIIPNLLVLFLNWRDLNFMTLLVSFKLISVSCQSFYTNLVTNSLLKESHNVLWKISWCYDDDVLKSFQVNLNKIGVPIWSNLVSCWCLFLIMLSKLGDHSPCWKGIKSFFQSCVTL